MSWFQKKKQNNQIQVYTAAGSGHSHPFAALSRYAPLTKCEKQLYRSLRESVPVIDAAIYKIVRLVGGFHVTCSSQSAQHQLDSFLHNVRVNAAGCGIESFICSYAEQMLTYGTAIGEIVLDSSGNIAALYNSDLDDVELVSDDNPLQVKICTTDTYGIQKEIPYPDLVMCSTIMPEPGKVYGTSLLKGLPFVTDILLKILNAIGTNWDRVGNVRFAVTYKPQESDRSFTKERIMLIAEEWSRAMKSREPRDFISAGDVSIKAIGADNQIPDSEIPVRQILEQIVAKLSIPPFLLGLCWSTTERMSSQQADILTSELEYYRRILEAPIRKICSTFLSINGLSCPFRIEWDSINLQDEVELAKARLYNAQADKLYRKENES